MEANTGEVYQTSSAVLLIIFNRPALAQKIFEQVKAARPSRLYVAADGPRHHVTGEAELCAQSRSITGEVDWLCEVKTLFQTDNLGCKEAVSSAITWFFEHEEEGIILEDDCLPANSFFRFCDDMLNRYRSDTRIRHISGCNLQHGQTRGEASYYFSNMTHVWGWAGWRRVWKDYDKDLKRYDEAGVKDKLQNIFNNAMLADDWAAIFRRLKAGEIDTWDYQLAFLNFFNNSLSVIPNCNLISNIGFGLDSTHTHNVKDKNANIPLMEIGEIVHPLYVLPDKQADFYTLDSDYHVTRRLIRYNRPHQKIKRWAKSLYK